MIRDTHLRAQDPEGWRAGGRKATWLLATAALLLLFALAPWALGTRTPVLRDVLGTHRPLKSFGADELGAGRIPAFRPSWALGQPFRGNPNAAPFYPGNLAYLVLPFPAAFGLHYAVHPLIGLLGAAVAARRLGARPLGATVAAITYAGSGFALSALSFYNTLVVVAWIPWAVAGVASPRRSGIPLAGLALGLAILGGEPVATALAGIVLAALAIDLHGVRGGAVRLLLVVGLAIAIGAVQLAATLQVLPYTYRFAHGMEPWEAIGYRFDWRRLAELALPLPWGSPARLGTGGYFASAVMARPPYFWTLYLGVLPLALLPMAWKGRRALAAVALLTPALAVVASRHGESVARLSAGLFRYPEKLIVPFTLAAALLVGLELERRAASGGLARALALAAGALAALGAALLLAFGAVADWLRQGLGANLAHAEAVGIVGRWVFGALLGATLLGLAALCARRGSFVAVAWIQAASLLQLAPLIVSDRASRYSAPGEVERRLPPGSSLVVVPAQSAQWEPFAAGGTTLATPQELARLAHFELQPSFGIERGFSYPTAPDLEGMTSVLGVFLERNLPRVPWEGRLRWSRRLGAEAMIRHDPGSQELPGTERRGQWQRDGLTITLAEVREPRRFPYWPRATALAANPRDAFLAVARGEVEEDVVVLSREAEHAPGGRIWGYEESGDRVRFGVASGGGVVVLGRAFWPAYHARLEGGAPLATQPVDLVLLGVEVPPGEHRVEIDVPDRTIAVAGLISLVALSLALLQLWRLRA